MTREIVYKFNKKKKIKIFKFKSSYQNKLINFKIINKKKKNNSSKLIFLIKQTILNKMIKII